VPATTLLPTLSQVHAWDTEHLEAAANHWTTTADTWDYAFAKVYQEAQSPGGTQWDGEAGDAAVLRAGTDRLRVLGAVDDLRGAAAIARNGASELHTAKELVLDAVADVEASGFAVGDDLSVTSRQAGGPPALQAARQAQAQALAATIRSRAAALAALDEEVAGQITTGTAGLTGIRFAGNPVSSNNQQKKPSIQAVDNHTWKQSPIPAPGPEAGTGGQPETVTKLGLPGHNAGTLPLDDTRTVYTNGDLRMRQFNDQLISQGMGPEERAKIMFGQRNSLRAWARELSERSHPSRPVERREPRFDVGSDGCQIPSERTGGRRSLSRNYRQLHTQPGERD
jgi:hypothetical protein